MADNKKETISTASKATRKKWLEKAKKTRASRKKELNQMENELLTQDLQTLLNKVESIDYSIRAFKQNKLNVKESKTIIKILMLSEEL